MLRESIEMIAKLPPMMSPTIPAWRVATVTPTASTRPVTGGKQPGKVPIVPPDLIASGNSSSDDNSSSDSDNHQEADHEHATSGVESEDIVMSDGDTMHRYKSIGHKSAQGKSTKAEDLGGKRLVRSAEQRTDAISAGPSSDCCCLLSPEQTNALPRRVGEAVLSRSPVAIKINIPSFLLPDLGARLKTLQASKYKSSNSDSPSPSGEPRPFLRKKLVPKKRLSSEDEKEEEGEELEGDPHNKRLVKHRRTLPDVSNSDSESDVSDGPSKRKRSSTSSNADREMLKHGRFNTTSNHDNAVKMKDVYKEVFNSSTKKAAQDEDFKAPRRTRDSKSPSLPESPRMTTQRKDFKDEDRDSSARNQKPSRDNSRRPANEASRYEKERSTKYRYRGHSRSPSRSRSKSPRRDYERNDVREIKPNRDRRDYGDKKSSSRNKRKEDSSRGRHDKPTKGRRDRSKSRSRSKSTDRNRGRERSRDKNRHSRSRSKEKSDRKRQREKRSHDVSNISIASSTKNVSKDNRLQSSQASEHTSERRGAQNRRTLSQHDTATKAPSSATTSHTVKRSAIEDQHQKRPESNVDTPKATTDSPALTSTRSVHGEKTNDLSEGTRRRPIIPTGPVQGIHTKHYRDYYRRYHALAVNLKRKADEITCIHNNPRLGAIVYFLSSNAFLRAFYFNDKHLELLHANRPDLAQKESMVFWESMKQFSTALSIQCHGKFQGLEGLSYLLEALVYNKCHFYSSNRLQQEMQALEQFRKRASKDNDGSQSSAESFVTIPTELAARYLQNLEDLANISTKLAECEVVFTPDIAKEQFPEAFQKWCIHPHDVGKPGGKGFLTYVEQRQMIIVSTGDESTVQEEKVKIPKVQWPLGTYMDLSNIMDFAEEALREYQARNGLECELSSIP
ncbi:hypothetical protein BGZ65_004671 [Modicella reniformis]|uniref:Uncharacterized protein n=1 Tax=Modicella reniformis TaxID=1440133 RepID=A0A9P6SPD5_9FUNG|nr:hypothetical protein BGZ65_004671 [Modicella reniformis]